MDGEENKMPVEEQARMMMVMMLCGNMLGAAYDLLAMMRYFFLKSSTAWPGLDVLFGGLCAFMMIAAGLLLRTNPFRMFAFAGVAAGFAFYMMTIGMIVRFFNRRIYGIVKKSFILDKKF